MVPADSAIINNYVCNQQNKKNYKKKKNWLKNFKIKNKDRRKKKEN